MSKNKKLLTDQELNVMYQELSNIGSSKEARIWHKKYKKYGYSLPFVDRYPNFLSILFYFLWSVGIVLAIVAITIITKRLI